MKTKDQRSAGALLPVVILLLASGSAFAQERGPSTPEERAQAVKLAHALEQAPLHKDAAQARKWLTVWLIQIPDITVNFCIGLLPDLPDSKEKYTSEIRAQMLFSQAAFVIEHAEQAKDDHAVYLAGVEGALKVYETILKEKPKAKHESLDDLLEKRQAGKLSDYVHQAMKKCE